jgi:ribosome-associated toxin RatA of RatAB toxin-antitoxin module
LASVRRSALLPYPAAAVFRIVNDVARYPEFLPWCSDASVLEQNHDELVAALSLKAGGLSHTFTTRNRLTPFEKIEMNLVSGPFSTLSGGWTFARLGEDQGCRVALDLSFRLNGAGVVFGSAFNRAADQMVGAFCRRADDLLKAT